MLSMARRKQTAADDGARDEAKQRKAVARAIKAALKQIAQYDPELAQTLRAEIRSGKSLSHIPGRNLKVSRETGLPARLTISLREAK